jgi:hypothetical protein
MEIGSCLLDARGHTLQSEYQAITLFTNKCLSDRGLPWLPWLGILPPGPGQQLLESSLAWQKAAESSRELVAPLVVRIRVCSKPS